MLEDFSVFKDAEELLNFRLAQDGLFVVRLDGVNFSALTRQFAKPFSEPFEHAMNDAAKEVFTRVFPTALLTYVTSDEISVVISDAVAELPYGRRIAKLTSISASVASVTFDRSIPGIVGLPSFDARALKLRHASHIREYITWRRLDSRKNATSMAAGFLHSHKKLMGVSTRERGELLVGTPFETIPEGTFNGRFITRGLNGVTLQNATRELTEELCAEASFAHLAARAK